MVIKLISSANMIAKTHQNYGQQHAPKTSFKGRTSLDFWYNELEKKRYDDSDECVFGNFKERLEAVKHNSESYRVKKDIYKSEKKPESAYEFIRLAYSEYFDKLGDVVGQKVKQQNQKLKELQAEIDAKQEALSKEKEKIAILEAELEALENEEKSNSIAPVYREPVNTPPAKRKGFENIAGYDKEVGYFKNEFIDKVKEQKDTQSAKNDIPNSMLLFGPSGCGKNVLIEAIAEELYPDKKERETYFKEIANYEEEVMDNLDKAMNEAKENFDKTHNQTIISIDYPIAFANEEEPETAKAFVDKLKNANDYHCTIFMTTNRLSDELPEVVDAVGVKNVVPVGPPNKDNIKALCKFYFTKEHIKDLDIDKLTDLFSNLKNGVVSGSIIEYTAEDNDTVRDMNGIENIIKMEKYNIPNEAYQHFLQEKADLVKKRESENE